MKYFSKAIITAKENKKSYKLYDIYPLISESYDGLNSPENVKLYADKYEKLLDSVDLVKKKTSDINLIDNIKYKALGTKNKQPAIVYAVIIGFSILLTACFISYSLRKDFMKIKNGKEITKQLIALAKEDINAFHVEFQKVYPAFYKTLEERYPELNVSDINFCSLIKMNLGIREIAQYTNSSFRAAEARKYRINKKMQLKNHNELYMTISMLNN